MRRTRRGSLGTSVFTRRVATPLLRHGDRVVLQRAELKGVLLDLITGLRGGKGETVRRRVEERVMELLARPRLTTGLSCDNGTISIYWKQGKVLRSQPVKIKGKRKPVTFVVRKGVLVDGGAMKVPIIGRVRFFARESWYERYGETRATWQGVYEFIRRRGAVWNRDIQREFRIGRKYVTAILWELLRRGLITREGVVNGEGREIPLRCLGYAYGVSPKDCASLVEGGR